ncbi:MAG: adenylate/guanylate cyclase domain-containing protein [Anaerolineae bacterium]|nr:adenylate/guanylate cyclase domain-containing protein [Anaerolineae bacterium]
MTVFLFTDIESFTLLWENHKDQMPTVLARHNHILEEGISGSGGEIVKNLGDGIFAVFEGGQPIQSAVEIQKRLARENWGNVGRLLVRMALHAGNAQCQNGDYYGPAVNRASRLVHIAWGGQILITPEVIDICDFPEDAYLHDLGVHLLKDLSRPQYVYEILYPDMPVQGFPPLRSLSARPSALPDALRTAHDYQVTSLAMYALVGVARVMEMEGRPEQAVELLALVIAHSPSDMVTERARSLLSELEIQLSPDIYSSAQQRGCAMDFEAVTEKLLSGQVYGC